MSADTRDTTYEQLMAINGAAFAEQAYELAYHALAAALQRAVDLWASDLLERVSRVATDQMERLRLPSPATPLVTDPAVIEGAMTTLYGTLAQMAHTRAESMRLHPEQGYPDGQAGTGDHERDT